MTDIEREDLLDRLITDCPVTVEFGNIGFNMYAGQYLHHKRLIKIDSCSSVAESIAVFFHEQKHMEDNLQNRPYCKLHDRTLAEYYAMFQALQKAYKLRDRNIIKAVVDENIWNTKNSHPSRPHYKAAKRVQGLKIWNKCLDFLGVKP